MISQKVTDLTSSQAKDFFREGKNYINFDLPEYFHFDEILAVAFGLVMGKSLKDLYKNNTDGVVIRPNDYQKVNYTILGNKDGLYAWRPYQIIHPVLYADLVNLITTDDNWKIIVSRFKDFSKSCVECMSIPRVSLDEDSHKATQVRYWWEEIEQRSIKLALSYDYVFSTDIVNCYGSIYTHSVEWALIKGGRDRAKQLRHSRTSRRSQSLGSEIDRRLQGMNYGQTNGIPQGSVIMDFIAEIVLGYADLELTNVLKEKGLVFNKDFRILRYRDDYKIFVNNTILGRDILKSLSDVLYELGMRMNPSKTSETDDVIMSSIKKEKLELILMAPASPQIPQKEALRIYQISKRYPNAGVIGAELSRYNDWLRGRKSLENTDIEATISIFSMIAVSSPKVINWVSAIVTYLLAKITDIDKRCELVKMMHRKFEKIPNSGLVDIWLQRISLSLGLTIRYKDKLTEVVLGRMKNSSLWESSWLINSARRSLNAMPVSVDIKHKKLSPVISRREVELFRRIYD